MAMSTAPPDTKIVPPSDHLVKSSPRIKVAQIELNTKPDYACKLGSRATARRLDEQLATLTEQAMVVSLSV